MHARVRAVIRSVTLAVTACALAPARVNVAVEQSGVDGPITILETGKQVLKYQYGVVPVPEGVGGPYAVARSDYLHPIYGFDGEVLTTDYAVDHPHHRGIYWAWPEVSWKGVTHDLHALQGVFARPEKILTLRAVDDTATIEAQNLWMWEDKTPIVRETVRIDTRSVAADVRSIDLVFRLEALQPGVTIARRKQTAYGGLNVRLSDREDQVITAYTDPAGTWLRRSWGCIAGTAPGGHAAVSFAIIPHVLNPHRPGDWVQYPELNWLQPTFPSSGMAYALDPALPLVLRYRLQIARGVLSEDQLAAAWTSYNAPGTYALSALSQHTASAARALMLDLEQTLPRLEGVERGRAEADLCALAADADAREEMRIWACQQLGLAGRATAVPALSPLIAGDPPSVAKAAVAALSRIPGPEAEAALLRGLSEPRPGLVPIMCEAVGQRRLDAAVAPLAELLSAEDPAVRETAARALAMVGNAAAAEALATGPGDWALKRLHCAQQAEVDAETRLAARIHQDLLAPTNTSFVRAAALIGLSRHDAGKEMLFRAREFLLSGDADLRDAGGTVLRTRADAAMCRRLATDLGDADVPVKLAVLEVLRLHGGPDLVGAIAAHVHPEAPGAVRLASVGALAAVGGADAVPILARLGAQRDALGRAARDGLPRLEGEGVSMALRSAAADSPSPIAVVLVQTLVARGEVDCVPLMLQLSRSPGRRTAAAAFVALGEIGGSDDLDAVLESAFAAPDACRTAAGQALAAICRRAGTDSGAFERVLAFGEATPARQVRLVEVLPSMGGPQALARVVSALKHADEAVQAAAREALLDWPTADALPAIAQARSEADDVRFRILALRAIARLLPTADVAPGAKSETLAGLVDDEVRPEELKLLAAVAARIRHPAILPALRQMLQHPDARAEVAGAIAKVSLPTDAAPGLAGPGVRAALLAAVPHLADEALAERVRQYADVVDRVNLAKGRPASSNKPHEGGWPPAKAVDGVATRASYWGCAEGPPAQLTVDLQQEVVVDRIRVRPYWDGRRCYQYFGEVSADGETWTRVIDQTGNTVPETPEGVLFEIAPASTRFVRVTMLRNSVNPGLHIVELEVYAATDEEVDQ